MRFNDALMKAVNATLNDEHKDILIERGRRIQEERKYEAKKRINKKLD
jgi:hypothetical protein